MSYRLLTLALFRSADLPTPNAAAIVEVREFEGDYDPTTAAVTVAVEQRSDLVDVATRGATKLAELAIREASRTQKELVN